MSQLRHEEQKIVDQIEVMRNAEAALNNFID